MGLLRAALAACALLAAGAAQAAQMTIVSWGGAYARAQLRAYHEPYTAATGTALIHDDSAAEAVAKLRAMHEAGFVTWDVVDVVVADAVRLCDEGLALELDPAQHLAPAPDGRPARQDFDAFWASDCYVPTAVYATVLGYRTDLVGADAPDQFCDLFDLQTYPGKRALERRPINNMEWALLCDGVPKAELYDVLATEAGQNRALAKLDTIKAHVIWWSAGADTPQLLADGEVVMGSGYNGRLFAAAVEQNQPIAILWDAQILDHGGWIIPSGLSDERRRQALEYVRFATAAGPLADLARYIPYSPARASSQPLIGRHADLGIDMAEHMPTAPQNMQNMIRYDYEFWADYRDDIDAKFQTWLAR